MNRKYAFDVLPSGNLFSELVDFTDTGYFDDQSQGVSWQQTCQEMTTYFREEPPDFDNFRQEEPDEYGDSLQKEPPERGDSPQKEPGKCGDLPQRPPERNDLPQEEAWAQPPSPLASLPSLTPNTTYTILTDISPPQINAMSLQMTNISSENTGISPQITSILPQMIVMPPQMTGMSPQEIPSPVSLPHAKTNVKPRKSRAIDRTNEHHCDFSSCNKVYTKKKFLNKHKKTHTKPFPCTAEGCKWRFARWSCFNRHMLSKHTASKPFQCRFCDKGFARSDNLVKHETVQCSVGLKLQRKNK